jgi:hypothetical protein
MIQGTSTLLLSPCMHLCSMCFSCHVQCSKDSHKVQAPQACSLHLLLPSYTAPCWLDIIYRVMITVPRGPKGTVVAFMWPHCRTLTSAGDLLSFIVCNLHQDTCGVFT